MGEYTEYGYLWADGIERAFDSLDELNESDECDNEPET